MSHPDARWTPTQPTANVEVGGARPDGAAHTGHAPGAVCLYAEQRVVFSGDTSSRASGRHRAFVQRPPTIEASIRSKLFALPGRNGSSTGTGPTPQSELSGPLRVTRARVTSCSGITRAMASNPGPRPKSSGLEPAERNNHAVDQASRSHFPPRGTASRRAQPRRITLRRMPTCE